jgi:2-deoxy-D-gluconate 3-dehydrogenase
MSRGVAQAGAAVAVLARTEAKVQALADEIQQAGGKALAVCGNVLDKASLESPVISVLDA